MSDNDLPHDPGPAQQSEAGADNLQGGGEFPSPDAGPTGPAPGTDPERRRQIEESREGDAGDASSPPPAYKEALERDPITGGSGSAPRTDRH